MANTPYEGKKYVFFIDPTNTDPSDEEFAPGLVVCLTENSYNRSASVVDASSKCGTYQFNGTKTRTIDIAGQVIFAPEDTEQMSEGDLNALFENDTPFSWLLGPETPVDGDQYYTGMDAVISDLALTAPLDGPVGFTATIQVNGVPVLHTEGS